MVSSLDLEEQHVMDAIMPPIPERHAIYIGNMEVVTFELGNSGGWHQDSNVVSIQRMKYVDFAEGRQVYLKSHGDSRTVMCALGMLGKRGFNLHSWNSFHVASL